MIIRPHDLANGENPAARPLPPFSSVGATYYSPAWSVPGTLPHRDHAPIGRNLTVTKREKATLASHLAFRRRERAALWRAGAFCRNPERSEGISKRKKADHISMIGLYFMPATTYSPTHFRAQYNRPCGA